MEDASVKKASLVLDVIDVLMDTMVIPTARLVTVIQPDQVLWSVQRQESVDVWHPLVDSNVQTVQSDTLSTQSVFPVTVTPLEVTVCLVTSMENAFARRTLMVKSVVNVKKDTTITLHVRSVIVILQESSLPSKDVVQLLPENFVNVRIESQEEFAINARISFGTSINTIKTAVKTVDVTDQEL